jgi:peptide deformylase
VREVNDEIRKLVADMAETMYEAPGIGLAATQVDVTARRGHRRLRRQIRPAGPDQPRDHRPFGRTGL